MKSSSKLSSVILWSVISAAFIGPGTVTTAVTAGSQFQLQLLWTVMFATLGCIVLQEISARIIIASGLTFGEALEKKFGTKQGTSMKWLVALPVLLGCAAYEAGNILGAVSGMSLLYEGDGRVYTVIITALSAIVLWRGGSKWISVVMTTLVGLMGIAFLFLALETELGFWDVTMASLVPVLPAGSEWIALALVGTTIVPYNIFIGSAISKGQTIPLMRIGLVISVLVGGLITAWILIAGTMVESFSSFSEVASALEGKIGALGALALGVGLFAAGFSSAITSPYAASLIASTVFGSEKKNVIRAVWISVLLIGFLFGYSGIKPIPVILTVQALNGFILPLLTYFLILIVNDQKVVPKIHQHANWYNLLLLAILGITLLIGLNNVDKAIVNGFNLEVKDHFIAVLVITAFALVITLYQLMGMKKSQGSL